jgi:opacity protein-like surface antigen
VRPPAPPLSAHGSPPAAPGARVGQRPLSAALLWALWAVAGCTAAHAETPPASDPPAEALPEPPPDAPDPGAPQPDPPSDDADAPPAPAATSPAQTPRERRREARRILWSGDVPPPESDFLRDHTDVYVRVGFGGYAPGPFSLFTAFAGWFDLGLRFDRGVAYWKDFTFSLGADLAYSNPAILAGLTQPIANYDEIAFRWRMWQAAGTLRGTLHYHRLQSVDPYLFAGVGAGVFELRARVRDWPTVPEASLLQPFVRIELGAGLSTRLNGTPWIIGGELRYVLAIPTRRATQLDLEGPDTTATFTLFPQHKPERGFAWGAHIGYRF